VHGRKIGPLECTLKSEKLQFSRLSQKDYSYWPLLALLCCTWNSHAHAPTGAIMNT